MLIEKFIVPASELADVGLQPIEMSRLGSDSEHNTTGHKSIG